MSEQNNLTAWWEFPEGERHVQIFNDLNMLRDSDQNRRMSKFSEGLAQYLDRQTIDAADISQWRSAALQHSKSQLHLNVSKSALDSIASKISPHKIKPMFVTVAGRWKDRMNARKLEQWSEGFLHREKFDSDIAPQVFIDGGIFGTGCVKYVDDPDENTFHIERVWPGELWIDETAAAYAMPRSLFQVRHMHKHQLIKVYESNVPGIEGIVQALPDRAAEESGTTIDEVVEVVEAWHLPSKKGAGDGKHVICVEGVTLFEREWKVDWFPFRFWRWGLPPLGFWGISLMEELRGIQDEVNKLLERIQDSMHVNATSIAFLPEGSKIDPADFSNWPGLIVPYQGSQLPSYHTPPSMAGEVYQHLWSLRDAAYEIAGVSQMTAGSKPPPNVESAVAFEYLDETETRRFAVQAERWQDFRLSVVEGAVDFQREFYGKKSSKVKWGEGTIVDEIDWKDIDLKRDAYTLRAYPVNFMPSHPAGKMRKIEKLASIVVGNQPMFTPSELKSLLDMPDLRKAMDLGTAAFEDTIKICDQMLYEGEEWLPEPEMDLDLGIRMAQHYWCLGHREGAPEENLDLLVSWMKACRDMRGQAVDAAEAAMGPMGPEMMGPGGAPPEMMGGPGADIPLPGQPMPPPGGLATGGM